MAEVVDVVGLRGEVVTDLLLSLVPDSEPIIGQPLLQAHGPPLRLPFALRVPKAEAAARLDQCLVDSVQATLVRRRNMGWNRVPMNKV